MKHYDIIVLGGGIIGCALGEELARLGQRVAIIERGRVGAEASIAAAGILSAQMDLPKPGAFFDLCQASRRLYPGWVRHLERRAGGSVQYQVNGLLYVAQTKAQEQAMATQARWQRRRGLRVERWSVGELRRHEPYVDGRCRSGFAFPTEAQVDNVRLMEALARACRRAKVDVQERTAVERILLRRRAVHGVVTTRGQVAAPVVVNTLGSWASLRGRFPVSMPVEPIRGQMLAFHGSRGLFRRTIMSERAYVVQRQDGRLVVGSTLERAGFRKAVTHAGIRAIRSGARHLSSVFAECPVKESWAGLRPCTRDKLPILGQSWIDGLYVATGHFRHGILLAPITAALMAEVILHGRSRLDVTPFSPARFADPRA